MRDAAFMKVWVAGLGVMAAVVGGCNEALPIDVDVVYRCQNSSQCGPGFTCQDLGNSQGKVCIDDSVVVADAVDEVVTDAAAEVTAELPPEVAEEVAVELPEVAPDVADPGPETDVDISDGDVGPDDAETFDSDDALDADADAVTNDGDTTDVADLCDSVTCEAPFACTAGFCVDPQGMVPVAAGDFYIGCNQSLGVNECIATTNQPQLKVTFAATYAIDRFEVTAAEYTDCWSAGNCAVPANLGAAACSLESDGAGGVQPKTDRDQHPVNCITQLEAQAVCTAQGKRLCTEAEWEKAARGGCEFQTSPCPSNMPRYAWGDDTPTCADYAHFGYIPAGGNGCGTNMPAPVGSYPGGVSAYGLYDTAGNVGEIVADCWHNGLTGAPQDGSEWTTDCANAETRRGGGYLSDGPSIRADTRRSVTAGSASPQDGVRCCRD